MALRPEDRPTYAQACFETFRDKHQPSRLTMSAAEFGIILQWMDKAYPLAVVLRAIDEMGGKPRTLLACEQPVNRAAAYWHQAMGGI